MEGGASCNVTDTPMWAIAVQFIVMILSEKAFRHFFPKKEGTDCQPEAMKKIKLGLIGIGLISLFLRFGQNFISAVCIPGMVPVIGNNQLTTVKDLQRWRIVLILFVVGQVLMCAYKQVKALAELSSRAVELKIQADRLIAEAPLMFAAIHEEESKLKNKK